MEMDGLMAISADFGEKPTGAGTPADALEVIQRMSQSDADAKEFCPTCGEEFANYRGVKIHHKKIHDESLRIQTCAWCGSGFEGKPVRKFCSRECQFASYRGGEKPSPETLRRMHHDEQKPLKQIADELGYSRGGLTNWMDEYGIEWRGRSEAERLKNEQRTEAERREQAKAAHDAVREAVEAGEWHLQTENPERNGYGKGWTEEKRETVRELYDRECQACGLTGGESKERFGSRLDVHHVIPWSYFDDPEKRNAVENLIPMCRSCHRKWEGVPVAPKVIE